MIFGGLLTAVILIVVGLSVKKNPDLLAGYHTLSIEKKEEIDIEKLKSIAKNTLVIRGFVLYWVVYYCPHSKLNNPLSYTPFVLWFFLVLFI